MVNRRRRFLYTYTGKCMEKEKKTRKCDRGSGLLLPTRVHGIMHSRAVVLTIGSGGRGDFTAFE